MNQRKRVISRGRWGERVWNIGDAHERERENERSKKDPK